MLKCSGRQQALMASAQCCARHGEVMTVGAPWLVEPELPASAIVAQVFERFLSLRSGWEWQIPRFGPGRSIASCTSWVLERLAAGATRTGALTGATLRPDEAADAYERLDREPERFTTFLFDWESAS